MINDHTNTTIRKAFYYITTLVLMTGFFHLTAHAQEMNTAPERTAQERWIKGKEKLLETFVWYTASTATYIEAMLTEENARKLRESGEIKKIEKSRKHLQRAGALKLATFIGLGAGFLAAIDIGLVTSTGKTSLEHGKEALFGNQDHSEVQDSETKTVTVYIPEIGTESDSKSKTETSGNSSRLN